MYLFSGFSVFFSLLVITFCLINDTETVKTGRRYRKPLFHSRRICHGCGVRIITNISSCLSCGRDFSKDSEGLIVQHRDNF